MNEETVKLKWAQGKCNKDVHFISENELIFACGSCLKSFRTDISLEIAIEGPVDGIQCLTADCTRQLIAVSDLSNETSIYVVEFSDFKILSQLISNVYCEYEALNFAGGEYLFSLESYPNFTITLYNWKTRQQIKEISYICNTHTTLPFKFTVHPFYHKIACFQQGIAMHFFEIEDIFQDVQLQMHSVYMPRLRDSKGMSVLAEKDVGNLTWFDTLLYESWGIHSKNIHDLPLKSICENMSDVEIVQFYDYLTRQERLISSCHCWLPNKDIIVACTNGSVLNFSFMGSFKKYLNFSDISAAEYDFKDVIMCMALSSIGLLVANNNGDVSLISDIDQWSLVKKFTLDNNPVSIKLSPNFSDVIFVTHNGSVWSTNQNKIENVICRLVHEVSDDIHVIGLCIIDDLYLVTAKQNGRIEVLDITNGKQISFLDVAESLEIIEGSPMCSIVILVTSEYNLFIVNALDIRNLRIIRKLRLYEESIVNICIENFGRYALVLSNDRKLFIISLLPSKEFRIMGYFTLICEVKSIDIFTNESENTLSIFLLCQPMKDSSSDNDYLLTLQIPKDFDEHFNQYWEDESGIFDSNAFEVEEIVLDYKSSNIAVHYDYGVILSNVFKNKVQNICVNFHNNFQENVPVWNEELVSPLNNSQLVLSASNNLLFVLLENGEIFMWCMEKSNDVFKIENCFTTNKQLRFLKCSLKDEYICIAEKFGFIKCYDISHLKKENFRPWSSYFEHEKEKEMAKLSEMKSFVDYEDLTAWSASMNNKLNSKVLSSIEKENEEFQLEILALSKVLDNLVEDNSLIPTEHQNAIEEFILDEKIKERFLKERDQTLKDYEYFLREKLSSELKITSNMGKECFGDMKKKSKIIRPLNGSKLLFNYSIPEFSELETYRMNYAYKMSQVNKCVNKLIEKSIENDYSEKLKYNESDYKEEIATIAKEFQQDIFLLQGHEEKVNYAYILQYIVYRKRLAFNKLFDKLVDSKKESIAAINSTNERINHILKQIEEEREIWTPSDDETLESYFQITEEEIEQNSPIATDENSTALKGLADYFLKDEWLLKLLNPTPKLQQPKLKLEVTTKLRKELNKLFKHCNTLTTEFDSMHNQLVESKLKWDINIIMDELQLFLICLCSSNKSLFKKLELEKQNTIPVLYLQITNIEKFVSEMDDAIVSSKKVRENIFGKMKDIYEDVEHLSKLSRDKMSFLEAFSERPPLKHISKTKNPYQVTLPEKLGSFQDLNSLKPKKTPANIWKEMSILREDISIIERDLKQNKAEIENFSKKKSDLKSEKNSLHSKVLNISNDLNEMHTEHLQRNFEVPMVMQLDYSQLEMQYPDNLNFQEALFMKKLHLEHLNRILFDVGSAKLELVQKQAKSDFQIERNNAKVRKMNAELRNLKTDMEAVASIPMGRELQNILQEPESFLPRAKMEALEKSAAQERAEIERQIKQVEENASRIKQKMENLNRGTNQRREEIEALKGNLAELHKLGGER